MRNQIQPKIVQQVLNAANRRETVMTMSHLEDITIHPDFVHFKYSIKLGRITPENVSHHNKKKIVPSVLVSN